MKSEGSKLFATLNRSEISTVSVRTEEIYERVVRLYLKKHLGNIRLNRLTPADVSSLMNALGSQGLSPSTKRLARSTLRRALRIAEQDGLIVRNVAAIAEGPKMNYKEGRTMTPEQAQLFLSECKSHRLGTGFALALSLGLRRGEVIGLKWTDIELTESATIITIRRQMVRENAGLRLSELKTKGSRRDLHLSPTLIELLNEHRISQEEEARLRGAAWHNDLNHIFTSTTGTPLDPGNFGRCVSTVAMKAGLGHWSIHGLRHSCASLMFSTGVPLEAVSDQLGHASTGITKSIYVHLLPGSGALASKVMENLLYPNSELVQSSEKQFVARRLARRGLANDNKSTVTSDLVGRPGLDPGTLGLKGTCELLWCVGLVAYVVRFQGIVLCSVGLVSWCWRNMRPKMRPV